MLKEFQKEDSIQYSVYGTPAESLCGRQVKKFREKYGVIENDVIKGLYNEP
ncbi:MAG: anaerobic ribonucleoside-triphosphate reductase [Lachnospiraceae bacterium]|nr:anaerobic ribonucleoside-triphosphate reductase [Lachnospiraceae bacterium]